MDIVESDLKQLFMWIKTLDARMTVIEKQLDFFQTAFSVKRITNNYFILL